MTHTELATLSNTAIASAAVVYFLAFLAHLAEWALQRGRPVPATRAGAPQAGVRAGAGAEDTALVGADGGPVSGAASGRAGGGADTQVRGPSGPPAERGDRVELFGRIGVSLTVLAAALHLAAVVSRGLAADPVRVPWGNMYEFTLTATWVVTAIYLVMFRRYRLGWLSPVVTGFVVAVLMLDVLVLYEPVAPLTPALHSYWLAIHVTAAIIATGAFTVGGMASVLYLVRERAERRGTATGGGYVARLPRLEVLDRVAYRMHAFGFPVWTFAALIAGPIWAEYAWSRYWGWDPKEVWAFITWVVYAGYLHARATAGWKGRTAAVVALVGLATLWFNFVGINFFFGGSSQHSYALGAVLVHSGLG